MLNQGRCVNVFNSILENANKKLKINPGDFKENGLWHCGKCKQAKQMYIDWPTNFAHGQTGTKRQIVRCTCLCEQEELEIEEALKNRESQKIRIEALQRLGMREKALLDNTFASDLMLKPEVRKRMLRYIEKWPYMYKEGVGIALWGDTSTGKTFYAACIANELISKEVPVLMMNVAKIMDYCSNFENRMEFLESLSRFKLLIIDDLGVERNTSFGNEILFEIINEWTNNKKPLIITTNLSVKEMKNPKTMEYKRIFERVLERCVPVHVEGENMREYKRKQNWQNLKNILLEE